MDRQKVLSALYQLNRNEVIALYLKCLGKNYETIGLLMGYGDERIQQFIRHAYHLLGIDTSTMHWRDIDPIIRTYVCPELRQTIRSEDDLNNWPPETGVVPVQTRIQVTGEGHTEHPGDDQPQAEIPAWLTIYLGSSSRPFDEPEIIDGEVLEVAGRGRRIDGEKSRRKISPLVWMGLLTLCLLVAASAFIGGRFMDNPQGLVALILGAASPTPPAAVLAVPTASISSTTVPITATLFASDTLVVVVTETDLPPATIAQASATPEPTRVIGSPIPISFSDSNNPSTLHPDFRWLPGASETNSYALGEDGVLTLIAGPGTDHYDTVETGSIIAYPYTGNFDVSIRLEADTDQLFQNVGLGIRSTSDPHTWVRLSKYYGYRNGVDLAIFSVDKGNGQFVGYERWVLYSQPVVFLMIQRRGTLFTFLYSADGNSWNVIMENHPLGMPDEVEIFFDANGHNDHSIIGMFSEFTVTNR